MGKRSLTRTHGLPTLAATTLLAALALTGCGTSDNGIASKTPNEILAASKAAAQSASSVHVTGNSSQGPFKFSSDLQLGKDEGRAKVNLLGIGFEAIRIGDTLYLKGGPAFYKALTHTTTSVPAGTWVKAPANNASLAQVAAFTNLPNELNRLISTPGSLTKGATTTLTGQPALELKETTKVYKGALYVATTGNPYPLQLTKTAGHEQGHTTFTNWNKHVTQTAPAPTIDLSSLAG